jgi:RNA polymerase sigma factor (sigma-70 family)
MRDAPEGPASLDHNPEAAGLLNLCRRLLRCGTLDLEGDCRQEALLALAKLADRLMRVPEAKRGAYVEVCVRNAVLHVLQREQRQRGPAISIDELPRNLALLTAEGAAEWDAVIADTLIEECADVRVIEALRALSSHDYAILDLAFKHELSDAEIAERVGLTVAAVKKRRQRALARLKRAIAGGGGRKGSAEGVPCLCVRGLLVSESGHHGDPGVCSRFGIRRCRAEGIYPTALLQPHSPGMRHLDTPF